MNQAERVQMERLRRMTPDERWRAARALYWSMRRLKAAFVRQQHPDWSTDRVEAEVKKAFTHVRG